MTDNRICAATPRQSLEDQILNENEPKNEREWWACRHIKYLRDEVIAERNVDIEQLRSELAALKADNESLKLDAERWRMLSALMFLGNVECTQDADGGYRIELDPAENMLGVSWEGNSPEEAIDTAMAQGEQG